MTNIAMTNLGAKWFLLSEFKVIICLYESVRWRFGFIFLYPFLFVTRDRSFFQTMHVIKYINNCMSRHTSFQFLRQFYDRETQPFNELHEWLFCFSTLCDGGGLLLMLVRQCPSIWNTICQRRLSIGQINICWNTFFWVELCSTRIGLQFFFFSLSFSFYYFLHSYK